MEGQLELIESPEWALDDTSRESGRRGIVQAREALDQARRRLVTDDDHQQAA